MDNNNTGTLVVAPIRPAGKDDTYPTAFANEVKGGHHTISSFNELSGLADLRRENGMLITALDTMTTYVLSGDEAVELRSRLNIPSRANDLSGGHRTVSTISELNSTALSYLEEGMFVTAQDTMITYVLSGGQPIELRSTINVLPTTGSGFLYLQNGQVTLVEARDFVTEQVWTPTT
jgi:hypothetical protein